MEEGTKVRLVRCPKCEQLLPELPNVAVYQCGGCGAVLQAKKRPSSSGGSSEKSDDERVRVSSEKLESFPEKGEGEGEHLSDASEVSDEESSGIKLGDGRREGSFPNRTVDSNSGSSSRAEFKVVNENIAVSKYDPRSLEKEAAESVGEHRRASKDPIDSRVLENADDMIKSREKSVRANVEKETGPNDPQTDIASRPLRSGQIPNWRSGERDGSVAYRRTPRAVVEDVRFSGSPYPDEGPSNYRPGSYGLVEPLENSVNSVGAGRVEHLEKDRAELLRKLDELNFLKDQLARSGTISEKPVERLPLDGRTAPLDPYAGRDAQFPQGSARQHHPPMQPFPAEKHAQRPLYSNHGLEPIPMMNRHVMDMQNFYQPLMHGSNGIPGYGDPFGTQMVGPSNPPHQYQQHPSRSYLPPQYMDMDPDHNLSYPTNTFFHQPACSCVHCYNKQWHAAAQVPSGVLQNRRFVDAPMDPMFYQAENRGTFGPTDYNHRDTNPHPLRHEPQPLVRRQRGLDADVNSFGNSRPRRVLPVKRNGRRCFPIAGGAPFITCHNCFELLPLPRKVLLMEKNYQKLRCGACSSIISLLVESKRIVVSVPAETNLVSPVVNDRLVEVVNDDLLHSRGQENHRHGTYSSDYDSSGSGYKFHLTDTELDSSSLDRRLTLSESEKLQSLVSSCSTTSEDEESPDTVIARSEVSNVAEVLLKAKGTPPIPGSPLHEYSSSNQVGSKFEKGNRSRHINREEVVPTKKTSRQNSVKDVSVATEMDVSFNEYSNAGMSQEYGELSREDQPKISKGANSYFVDLIKKGFRDISKSHPTGENDRSNVSINGQPMSERLLKKAEKQSGAIHPGQYWYDFRAGFWGVMGQPCLGIIPPFIEEFNFPMPTNCAGGNTGVYVNGRELHQKDLDLLANRGLPRATNNSYIIEISGRVVDEDSGEELDNLGKLAPTVEKLKRGFGMRIPRVAA